MDNISLSKHSSYNIGDSIYYSLRKNIISVNFKPGEALSIKEISEKLNVSRSPVRDALIKLGKEGLVDIIPQKGTSVSKIDLKRVDEERFLRNSLEENAIRLFIKMYKESDIAILRNNIEMQKQSLNCNDYLSFLDYDDSFHSVFFKSIDKTMCWEILQSMCGHYRRVRLMSLWDDKILTNVVTQHQQIIENICHKNFDKAIEMSQTHLTKISMEETELIKKYPEFFKEQDDDNFLIKDFYNRI
ncbi:GntR family transcriptional regulator [Cellulosilyticum sp. I15G10I2]|uniref:GntR family transcriptional regulator n=1 Tax=Cellulosilyticum sp. I15G10I2 TaxID=1892843 RepID=UPI00085CDDED|nr:GntR family transcriptional regulator [Cellulosilyticum sp. I15G10I2]